MKLPTDFRAFLKNHKPEGQHILDSIKKHNAVQEFKKFSII